MSSNLAQATRSTPLNGTVPPRPVPQAQRRPREYLTPKDVERLKRGEKWDPAGVLTADGGDPPLVWGSLYQA